MRPEDIDAARFWLRVRKGEPSDCWHWTGALTSKGYGAFGVRGVSKSTHRIAWVLTHGRPIPRGLVIRHACHVRACCNPAHLSTGTHADNERDKVEAGRSTRGERNPRGHLTADIVAEIRRVYVGRYGQGPELARRFGCTPQTIRDIAKGRTWTHLDP